MIRTVVTASAPLSLMGLLCLWGPSWGFWSVAHAGWLAVPFLALALALPILLPAVQQLRGGSFMASLARAYESTANVLARLPRWAVAATLPVGAFALFWLARQGLFAPPPEGLGDSLDLARRIPVFTEIFGYLDSFDEILALYFRSRLYAWLSPLGFGIETAGALWSCLWGALFVATLAFYLRGASAARAGLAVGLFAGTPALQVFCGYLENYAEPMFFVTAILAWGSTRLNSEELDQKASERHLAGIAALAALGALFHLVVGVLLPALAFLWYRSGASVRARVRSGLLAGLSASLVLLPVWLYFLFGHPNPIRPGESHAVRPPIVPLRELPSPAHLFDQLNLWLLVLPSVFLLLALGLYLKAIRYEPTEPRTNPETAGVRATDSVPRFFAIAVVSFAGFAFFVNPLLGMPADWDLLSFVSIPVSFLLLEWFTKRLDRVRALDLGLPLGGLLFACCLLTAAWIARNARVTETDRRNLERAAAQTQEFVREIRADSVFARVPSNRRKQYVRARHFAHHASAELRVIRSPEADSLHARLASAMRRYMAIATAPDEVFAAELPPIWRELTAVNQGLLAITRVTGRER